jgi:phage terminase large subunit-like protein
VRSLEDWIRTLSDEERTLVRYDWKLRARPEQLVPLEADHPGYLYQCGRGWGKTLCGVETIYALHTHPAFISHCVAPTTGDLTKVLLNGPSGFLSVRPPELQPKFNANEMVLAWPNGGRTLLFSAEVPKRLRGPECDFIWFDEFGVYREPEEVFDNAMFGLRRGMAKFLITTTPAPTRMMKKLRAMPRLYIYQGASTENRALSIAYDAVLARYKGTRKERQEIFGEYLEDNPGALDGWTLENISALRVESAPPLRRCYIGIDPAVTSHEDSDETGIVAVGQGEDRHAYVLRDASGRHQPERWARIAVNLYHELKADKIVAEGNNGGDLVASVIANVDPNVPVEIVHATRGKAIRAEPVSLWYHQRRAHHVGVLDKLEDELAAFDPELWEQGRQASPNRLDALVWAFNPFCEGPSEIFGLLDWLKGGGAQSILEPKPTRTPPVPVPAAVVVAPDHGPCAECGYARLQELPGGNQLRCQQCGKQSWVDGRRPEVAVGRRNSAVGIGVLGRWGDNGS